MIGVGWLMVAILLFPFQVGLQGAFSGAWSGWGHLGLELLLSSASGGLVLTALNAQGLITNDEGQNVNLDSSLRKVTNINYKF
jgi:hypothetical protein